MATCALTSMTSHSDSTWPASPRLRVALALALPCLVSWAFAFWHRATFFGLSTDDAYIGLHLRGGTLHDDSIRDLVERRSREPDVRQR